MLPANEIMSADFAIFFKIKRWINDCCLKNFILKCGKNGKNPTKRHY